MSACLSTDIITPRNAQFTVFSKCNVIPAITTHTFSATEVSCQLTSWAVSNGSSLFVSLSIPTLNFVGDGTTVTCSAISTLVAPLSTVQFACVLFVNGATMPGLVTINTDRSIIISFWMSDPFPMDVAVKFFPVIVTYKGH